MKCDICNLEYDYELYHCDSDIKHIDHYLVSGFLKKNNKLTACDECFNEIVKKEKVKANLLDINLDLEE